MGTKNAATVAQNAYTHALHHMLPGRSFPNIANFADDFLGGADSEESLIQTFEDFLIMCKKANITLNPLKVRANNPHKNPEANTHPVWTPRPVRTHYSTSPNGNKYPGS
jgi:hypothetical protein